MLCEKSDGRLERKLAKYEEKTGWYSTDKNAPNKFFWRSNIHGEWKGSEPEKSCVPDMPYTSVLQVPRTRGGRLLREIARLEPRLAKATGYHVKLLEKSGRPLSKFFNKNTSSSKCHREDCTPCNNPNIRGSSMCMAKGVDYGGVCSLCESKHRLDTSKTHEGMYIDQTSRTLYERCLEHMSAYKRFNFGSFMFKNWAICHKDSTPPPP